MSRISRLFENEEKQYTKFAKYGNHRTPVGNTEDRLDPGVYAVSTDMNGKAVYTKMVIESDALIREGVEEYQYLIEEVRSFWEKGDNFKKFGFTHKRGLIMYGEPGAGKTSVINMLVEDTQKNGDVVFIAKSPYDLVTCVKSFREVEQDRRVLVIMEDFDNMMHSQEYLLQLLDGSEQMGGVMYIATTNYLENIPERLRKRPSRFDRVVEIKPPNQKGRRIYFERKLKDLVDEKEINQLVEETEGLTFAHLKELVISVYCLENELGETVARLRDMSPSGLTNYGRNESNNLVKEYISESKVSRWVKKSKMLS